MATTTLNQEGVVTLSRGTMHGMLHVSGKLMAWMRGVTSELPLDWMSDELLVRAQRECAEYVELIRLCRLRYSDFSQAELDGLAQLLREIDRYVNGLRMARDLGGVLREVYLLDGEPFYKIDITDAVVPIGKA